MSAGSAGEAPVGAPLASAITWGSVSLFVILRAWTISAAAELRVLADEAGSVAIARLFSAFPAFPADQHLIKLADQPEYPLIPGAVLTPIWWLPLDDAWRYRTALAILACAGLGAAWCVRRLVSRIHGPDPLLEATAFGLALLAPALMYSGTFVWAEQVAVLWFAALLLAAVVAADERSTPVVVAASLLAGAAPFAHGRFTAIPVIWVAIVAVEALRRRDRASVTPALLAVAVTAAAVGVLALVHAWAVDRIWIRPLSPFADLADQLSTAEFVGRFGYVLVGQLWYALAASAGLLGVAAWWAITAISRRASVQSAAIIVAMSGGIVLGSTAFLASHLTGATAAAVRLDHLAYGRYIDPVVLVGAAIGFGWVWHRVRTWQPLAALSIAMAVAVVSATIVSVFRPDADGGLFSGTVAGVAILPFDGTGELNLTAWTTVAAVVAGLIGFAAARGRQLAAGGTVGLWAALAVMGADDARSFHLAADNGALTDWADTQGGELVIASDTAASPVYRFFVSQQQFGFADEGWHAAFDERDSSELTADPEGDALALLGDTGPDGWDRVGGFDQVSFWVRPTAPRAPA